MPIGLQVFKYAPKPIELLVLLLSVILLWQACKLITCLAAATAVSLALAAWLTKRTLVIASYCVAAAVWVVTIFTPLDVCHRRGDSFKVLVARVVMTHGLRDVVLTQVAGEGVVENSDVVICDCGPWPI